MIAILVWGVGGLVVGAIAWFVAHEYACTLAERWNRDWNQVLLTGERVCRPPIWAAIPATSPNSDQLPPRQATDD